MLALKQLPKASTTLRGFLYEFCVGLSLGSHAAIVAACGVGLESADSYSFLTEPVLHGDLIAYIRPKVGRPRSLELRGAGRGRWAWSGHPAQPGPQESHSGQPERVTLQGPHRARRSGGMDAPLRVYGCHRGNAEPTSQAHPGPTGSPQASSGPPMGLSPGPPTTGSPPGPSHGAHPRPHRGQLGLCLPGSASRG